jgi:hypothetical protein
MKLRCVGCRREIAAHEDVPHTQECEHHAHHTPKGWTECRHPGQPCFEQISDGEAAA